MRLLIETTDRSLVESLRMALESEGIDAHVSDRGATSLPFVPIVVSVFHDEDFAAAQEVLQSLQQTQRVSELPPAARRTGRIVLVILVIGVIAWLYL